MKILGRSKSGGGFIHCWGLSANGEVDGTQGNSATRLQTGDARCTTSDFCHPGQPTPADTRFGFSTCPTKSPPGYVPRFGEHCGQ